MDERIRVATRVEVEIIGRQFDGQRMCKVYVSGFYVWDTWMDITPFEDETEAAEIVVQQWAEAMSRQQSKRT